MAREAWSIRRTTRRTSIRGRATTTSRSSLRNAPTLKVSDRQSYGVDTMILLSTAQPLPDPFGPQLRRRGRAEARAASSLLRWNNFAVKRKQRFARVGRRSGSAYQLGDPGEEPAQHPGRMLPPINQLCGLRWSTGVKPEARLWLPVVVRVAALADVDDEGAVLAGVDRGELIDGLAGELVRGVLDGELEAVAALRPNP